MLPQRDVENSAHIYIYIYIYLYISTPPILALRHYSIRAQRNQTSTANGLHRKISLPTQRDGCSILSHPMVIAKSTKEYRILSWLHNAVTLNVKNLVHGVRLASGSHLTLPSSLLSCTSLESLVMLYSTTMELAFSRLRPPLILSDQIVLSRS